jgi:phospholipase/carboxylesterase
MRACLVAVTLFGLATCAADGTGAATPVSVGSFPGDGDTVVAEPIVYTEEIIGGAPADAPLPMVVLLHGKLGRPENIRRAFTGLRGPVRIIVPRGAPFEGGYVWWDLHVKDADPLKFAAGAREATRRVAALVRRLAHERPTLGRPVVAGFSQGAIVAYSLAVLHPDLVSAVFPLSGTLPVGLEPAAWPPGHPLPIVRAFHGEADPIVSLSLDQASVARLVSLGVPATLTVFPAMRHVTAPEEMGVVLPQLDAALRQQATGARFL